MRARAGRAPRESFDAALPAMGHDGAVGIFDGGADGFGVEFPVALAVEIFVADSTDGTGGLVGVGDAPLFVEQDDAIRQAVKNLGQGVGDLPGFVEVGSADMKLGRFWHGSVLAYSCVPCGVRGSGLGLGELLVALLDRCGFFRDEALEEGEESGRLEALEEVVSLGTLVGTGGADDDDG